MKSQDNLKIKSDRTNPKLLKQNPKQNPKKPTPILLNRKPKKSIYNKQEAPSLFLVSPEWYGVDPSLAWAIPVIQARRSKKSILEIQERDRKIDQEIALEKRLNSKNNLKVL